MKIRCEESLYYEVLGGILLLGVGWLALSLASYCPGDYGADLFPHHLQIHNSGGELGSRVARWFFFHLGWLASWLSVLFFLLWSVSLFFRHFWTFSTLPLGGLLLVFATLESDLGGFGGANTLPPGGVYGIYFAAFFKSYLPFWGRYLLYLLLAGGSFFWLVRSWEAVSYEVPQEGGGEEMLSDETTALFLGLNTTSSSDEEVYLPLEAGTVLLVGGESVAPFCQLFRRRLPRDVEVALFDSRCFFPTVPEHWRCVRQVMSLREGASEKDCILVGDLGDWMALRPGEVLEELSELHQQGKILILITTRPSTDVLSPELQKLITHRLAFAVPTRLESCLLFGAPGAEELSEHEALWRQEGEEPLLLELVTEEELLSQSGSVPPCL